VCVCVCVCVCTVLVYIIIYYNIYYIYICYIIYERKPSRSNPLARQFPGLINNQGERLNNNTEIDSCFFFPHYFFLHFLLDILTIDPRTRQTRQYDPECVKRQSSVILFIILLYYSTAIVSIKNPYT
jgi:hypothetical protein